jgi:hypothetical protein
MTFLKRPPGSGFGRFTQIFLPFLFKPLLIQFLNLPVAFGLVGVDLPDFSVNVFGYFASPAFFG